jgi:hypothetical protein
MSSSLKEFVTIPCFIYVEIGRQPKDHQRQIWTFQRTFRAHRTVASTRSGWLPDVGCRCNTEAPSFEGASVLPICYQKVV